MALNAEGTTMGGRRYLVFRCAICQDKEATTAAVWTSEKRGRFLRALGWRLPDEHDASHPDAWHCPRCARREDRS